MLEPAAEAESADEFRYDPADPALTGLDVRKYPFEDVPLDQTATETRDDVLSLHQRAAHRGGHRVGLGHGRAARQLGRR